MEIKAFVLLFLSATVGVCYADSDISLKWSMTLVGEIGMTPLVEVLVDSSVDIYSIDLVVGYQFPNSPPVIGTFSLFPTIIDGEWESTFDAISLDVDSSTISGASSLGQPIEAGSYSLLRFQFPPSVEGSGFCILDSSKFWNADQSVSYEFEGPGCTVLSVPEAIMEFTKPREVDGEIEVGLRMELTKELFGFEMVTTGPTDGDLGSDSLVNEYFDKFGNITKFLMFSLEQTSISPGEYDDFMLFRFPLTDQGETFCVSGEDETVMSGENGVALVTMIPGCVVLDTAPPGCDDAGTGDIVADGLLDVVDIVLTVNILLGEVPDVGECDLATIDVNLDATNDVGDIISLVQKVVGI